MHAERKRILGLGYAAQLGQKLGVIPQMRVIGEQEETGFAWRSRAELLFARQARHAGMLPHRRYDPDLLSRDSILFGKAS